MSTVDTTALHGGYNPGNGEPRQVPIYQSTTWKYSTSEDMGKLFDLEASGYFYTRLQNPTNDLVAGKICELEGIDRYRTEGFVLEGGSFHVDGEGTILTTSMCLLSKGRNPNMKKADIGLVGRQRRKLTEE